ncbi:hypothetical protein BKA70DRAFT_6214 [Coprinopsis sp. MPI-PUGE-AT-0042]|nr:hypothetical protein BKA70DRAFT_6214 [Coprinopsis sp. MPI-PUGE-AT-0042]
MLSISFPPLLYLSLFMPLASIRAYPTYRAYLYPPSGYHVSHYLCPPLPFLFTRHLRPIFFPSNCLFYSPASSFVFFPAHRPQFPTVDWAFPFFLLDFPFAHHLRSPLQYAGILTSLLTPFLVIPSV